MKWNKNKHNLLICFLITFGSISTLIGEGSIFFSGTYKTCFRNIICGIMTHVIIREFPRTRELNSSHTHTHTHTHTHIYIYIYIVKPNNVLEPKKAGISTNPLRAVAEHIVSQVSYKLTVAVKDTLNCQEGLKLCNGLHARQAKICK